VQPPPPLVQEFFALPQRKLAAHSLPHLPMPHRQSRAVLNVNGVAAGASTPRQPRPVCVARLRSATVGDAGGRRRAQPMRLAAQVGDLVQRRREPFGQRTLGGLRRRRRRQLGGGGLCAFRGRGGVAERREALTQRVRLLFLRSPACGPQPSGGVS
jgi:hypothetical protein